MEKKYTIDEYNELKQKVINLRQAAVAEQGSSYYPNIHEELIKLEEELENAKIIDTTNHNMNIINKKR